MDWSGVDYLWIIGMFYQLFGLAIWRHPFTANDAMVSKWCNAKFLQICSDKETNSSTSCIAWGWVHFQKIFIFGWTFPLSAKSGRTSSTLDRFWNVYDRPLYTSQRYAAAQHFLPFICIKFSSFRCFDSLTTCFALLWIPQSLVQAIQLP